MTAPLSTAPLWEIAEGLTPYPDAVARMTQRAADIRAGTASELVWLVEHPPLYTAGTSSKPEDLTVFPPIRPGAAGIGPITGRASARLTLCSTCKNRTAASRHKTFDATSMVWNRG